MGKTAGQGEGVFPLTLLPSWDAVHHLNEIAGIGSFLLTIFLVYLALNPTVQVPDRGADQPIGRRLSIRRLRRPIALGLAFIFGLVTIASIIFAGQTGPQESHLSTAYWYRIELEKLNTLMAHWERVTNNTLNNYLDNRGELPYSENDNLGSIESNIKAIVHDDFSIDLDLTRHPNFDSNLFRPMLTKYQKDVDKAYYRRLYDQYSQMKYTLQQVLSAYKMEIIVQEDYVKKNIHKPTGCYYLKNGNFECRNY